MSFFISEAHAQAASTGGGDPLQFIIMIGVFFAIMYFMIIRPQSKRTKEHKSLINSLNKGDEVVTNGGVLGKVTALDDSFITIKIATDVEVQIQRQAVSTVMPKGTMKK